MSDANKFVNTYIDTTIATLHEYLSVNLQLKSQLKLANELVQEKDQLIATMTSESEQKDHDKDSQISNIITEKDGIITSLSTQLEQTKKDDSEIVRLRERNASLEESYNAMKNKISHMDTLNKQVGDMKNEIIKLLEETGSLRKQLDEKDLLIENLSKPTQDVKINSKKEESIKKKVKAIPLITETENDDF